MRARSPVALLVLCGPLLFATAAHAVPIKLRWNACWGDGGVMNRDFACDTNSQAHVLVGSFVSPVDFFNTVGAEAIVDLAVAGGSLPPWWQFRNTGSCRQTSLTLSTVLSLPFENCFDWAQGQAIGGIADYAVDPFGPGSARIRLASAVPSVAFADILAGQEYFSFLLGFNSAKTVGTGSCAGCELGACIALKYIRLTGLDGTSLTLEPGRGSAGSDERLVTWQGGAGVVFQLRPDALNCPLATPTRGSTWGALKAMYR